MHSRYSSWYMWMESVAGHFGSTAGLLVQTSNILTWHLEESKIGCILNAFSKEALWFRVGWSFNYSNTYCTYSSSSSFSSRMSNFYKAHALNNYIILSAFQDKNQLVINQHWSSYSIWFQHIPWHRRGRSNVHWKYFRGWHWLYQEKYEVACVELRSTIAYLESTRLVRRRIWLIDLSLSNERIFQLIFCTIRRVKDEMSALEFIFLDVCAKASKALHR